MYKSRREGCFFSVWQFRLPKRTLQLDFYSTLMTILRKYRRYYHHFNYSLSHTVCQLLSLCKIPDYVILWILLIFFNFNEKGSSHKKKKKYHLAPFEACTTLVHLHLQLSPLSDGIQTHHFLKKFLLLYNYSCMPFLSIPPPHPS